MDIKLNDVFHLSDEEIQHSKIELNLTAGRNGDSFFDMWLALSDSEKESGHCKDISFWPWFGGKKNYEAGQFVFSFVRLDNDMWLFVSAAKILSVPSMAEWRRPNVNEMEIPDRFRPYFGKLIMQFHKGNAMGRYTFKLAWLKGRERVQRVLSNVYNGEEFDGYDNVHLEFRKLNDIYDGKIMPTYREALKKITGVYCLTDTKTGKLYIGSATGTDGVLQRWKDYLTTKHGGDEKLRKLYEKEGDDYFERYFQFTLIEYFGLSMDPEKVKERENYWKHCLDTVNHGYNDNW